MFGLIKNENIFSQFHGNVYAIEYPKRNLPHMHHLIFVNLTDEFLEASYIDKVICAKLPTIKANPTYELVRIVISVMLHDLFKKINFNSHCMNNAQDGSSRYTKYYPCNFFEKTSIQENDYPLYWQYNNGSMHEIPHPQDQTRKFTMDNRWVVPYNLYLIHHFKTHINVEICSSVQAIQYIYKYIYKNSDRATIQVDIEKDEVAQYL